MWLVYKLKALFDRSAVQPGVSQESPRFIKDEESGALIETDDPMQAAAIALVLKTGKPVAGTRDGDGKFTIKSLDP